MTLAVSPHLVAQTDDRDGLWPSLEMLEYLGLLVEGQDDLIGPEFFKQENADDNQIRDDRDDPKTRGTSTEEAPSHD